MVLNWCNDTMWSACTDVSCCLSHSIYQWKICEMQAFLWLKSNDSTSWIKGFDIFTFSYYNLNGNDGIFLVFNWIPNFINISSCDPLLTKLSLVMPCLNF